jgi:hypothetical protein
MPAKARCYSEKDQERVSSRHPPPLIDDFAEDLADSLTNVFPSDDELLAQLRTLVRHRDEISPNVRQLLVNELQALAVRATEFANDLRLTLSRIRNSRLMAAPPGAQPGSVKQIPSKEEDHV